MLINILLVSLGSAIGGALRYSISYGLHYLSSQSSDPAITKQVFYWAIILINLTGCLAIGIMAAFTISHLARTFSSDGPVWLLFAVGILGGYTTFSAFGLHLLEMLQQNNFFLAVLYVLISVGGGIFCAYGGFQLGKLLTSL